MPLDNAVLLPFEQIGHSPGKPEKVGEFDIGQEKVGEVMKIREIVVCLWCAASLAVVTNKREYCSVK